MQWLDGTIYILIAWNRVLSMNKNRINLNDHFLEDFLKKYSNICEKKVELFELDIILLFINISEKSSVIRKNKSSFHTYLKSFF